MLDLPARAELRGHGIWLRRADDRGDSEDGSEIDSKAECHLRNLSESHSYL